MERLDDISKESEKHIEEAIGLTDWIIDSPFSNVDTLKLIHKTLQITKGQIDRYSNIDDSINILCEYGREFCLIVLECIQMILTNEHNKYLDVYSKNFESSLNKFLLICLGFRDLPALTTKYVVRFFFMTGSR